MIEAAKTKADPAKFAKGARSARESGGLFEIRADTGESRIRSQKERQELKQQKEPVERSRKNPLQLDHCPQQTGWAALKNIDDLKHAFAFFRDALTRRGFSSKMELIAVH